MPGFNRITSDPAVMNGQPCIRGLRLTVRRVLVALATYPDREELHAEYPELENEPGSDLVRIEFTLHRRAATCG
jgi:uncharacterized protein (DUF433 family)